jgi:hypothetical protein
MRARRDLDDRVGRDEGTSDAHTDAERQLDTALKEEIQAGKRYREALGKANELDTFVALRAANDHVAARQTFLAEFDEELVGGRVTVNGREVGGVGSIFL